MHLPYGELELENGLRNSQNSSYAEKPSGPFHYGLAR